MATWGIFFGCVVFKDYCQWMHHLAHFSLSSFPYRNLSKNPLSTLSWQLFKHLQLAELWVAFSLTFLISSYLSMLALAHRWFWSDSFQYNSRLCCTVRLICLGCMYDEWTWRQHADLTSQFVDSINTQWKELNRGAARLMSMWPTPPVTRSHANYEYLRHQPCLGNTVMSNLCFTTSVSHQLTGYNRDE